MVLEKGQPNMLHPTMPLLTLNTDLTTYVNSKLLYISQAGKQILDHVYKETVCRGAFYIGILKMGYC